MEADEVAGPGAAGYEGSAGGTGGKAEGKAGFEKGGSNEWRRGSARRAWPQSRPSDGGSGSGRPMEPLLHFGSGGGNTGRGTVADDAGGFCNLFPRVECSACGVGDGDTLGLGAGSHTRVQARSSGGQPAGNEGIQRAQAEESPRRCV